MRIGFEIIGQAKIILIRRDIVVEMEKSKKEKRREKLLYAKIFVILVNLLYAKISR